MQIRLADNGIGIEKEDLKHILNGSINAIRDGLKKAAVLGFLSHTNL